MNTTTKNVHVRHEPESHRFDLYIDGEHAATLSYRWTLAMRTFVHAEVDDEFEGRGVGFILVAEALEITRAERLKIEPRCPFVLEFLKENREYIDLVPMDLRARYGLDISDLDPMCA